MGSRPGREPAPGRRLRGAGEDHLVLYARVPRLGSVKTRLVPLLSPEEALDLHRALLRDSLTLMRAAATATGARPVVAFSESWEPEPSRAGLDLGGCRLLPQIAGNLGERLEATFEALLADAGGRVVVLGSDSPDLPPRTLAGAFGALQDAEVVLGPAADGGFYLLGSRVPLAGMLRDVLWGTASALADVRSGASGQGRSVVLLEPWDDVDRPGDLARLAERLAGAPHGAPLTAAFLARPAIAARLAGVGLSRPG